MPPRETSQRAADFSLTTEEIKALLEEVSSRAVEELEIESGSFRLRIVGRRQAQLAAPPVSLPPGDGSEPGPAVAAGPPAPASQPSETRAAAEDDPQLSHVRAPMIGTFYTSPAPGTAPFVKVGDTVEEGAVLCIIEAMKLMNEIKAEIRGVIRKILVENGQPVEYGQPIFAIDPM